MSLAPSRDQAMTATTQSESPSVLVERTVAIAFLATALVAMMGWLYMLVVALWSGASWLLS
jgi:hypothetical protein